MLQRMHIHNFRCLQNFEIKPGNNTSLLLIGKNGSGKSTLANALCIFQKLGGGTSRTSSLVTKEDFALGRTNERIRFEMEAVFGGRVCAYSLCLDMPENFKELRVVEEDFSIDGVSAFTRQEALVTISSSSEFSLDWHTVALPLITLKKEPALQMFRDWLHRMHILAPVPQLIGGESHGSLEPLHPSGKNLADYLTALLNDYPATYSNMQAYLKDFMPDLREFSNKLIATDSRMIRLHFGDNDSTFEPKLDQISDGEKCMFLCAVVLASQKVHDNLFVFWDEPDNYLALPEIEAFIRALRRNFCDNSQIWMTSHNENTINCFSHENTLFMRRKNHFDPVELRPIHEIVSDSDSIIHKIRLNELE